MNNREDRGLFMNHFEDLLTLISEEEERLFNSLSEYNRSLKSDAHNKTDRSELGGYMSPGAKEPLPSYFPTAKEIEESFRKDVLEVIRNA